MRIAVLGVGLIGGSIGMAARARLDGVEVVGAGRDPARLERARGLGAIDRAASSIEEALDGADACFACGPVGALPGQIRSALAAADAGCVVTDAGSTKRALALEFGDERYIGGHPIAGAETSGVEHARPDLFEGATWYLTPGERSSGLLLERLHRMVAALGARPVAIDAEAHDRLLATVSHLPHVLANVLADRAASRVGSGDPPPRIGPSFRDATRVAGASTEIWRDIYVSNADAIADEIDQAVAALERAAGLLRAGDGEAIAAWNDDARESRRRLLEADLAAGQVHELRLTVPNEPGVVAQVALALGRAGVNIADLALAPAPDMRTGAITLWVAGDEDAGRAETLIAELGFPVARA